MARPDECPLDPWSGLNHKGPLAGGESGWLAPVWVGDHRRRLTAYIVLTRYLSNAARTVLTGGTSEQIRNHREYGDPALLVAQVRAALLADMRITVDGAEGEPPPQPIDPGPGAGDEEQAEFDDRLAAWKASLEDRKPALDVQDWFDGWAPKAKFKRVIVENEETTIGLGDGFLTVGWSTAHGRPVVRAYDPGFGFPSFPDFFDDDEFPPRIDFAWEEWIDDPRTPLLTAPKVQVVHRITYELVDLTGPGVDLTGREGLLAPLPWEEGSPEETAGEGVRRSTKRAFLSEGWWYLDQVTGAVAVRPDRFPAAKAHWLPDPDDPTGVAVLDHKPLGIDFLPVIHVPNTIPRGQFWGMSILTLVAQLFDDIAASDSDEQSASAIVGTPPIWIKDAAGADGILTTYGPGMVWKLSTDGQAGMIDVSKALDAIAGHIDRLLKRLSVNARVPAEILGRVNASEVPSGVAMALAFGPFQSLIDDMRLIRSEKYALLLKFVARLAQLAGPANGGLPAGPLPEVELTFGSYLPSDLTGIVTLLLTALEAHGLSRATFLRLAAQAGLELGDLVDEEARIRSEDFEGAGLLADATGSDTAAAEYLGVELPEKPAVSAAGVAAAAAVGGVPATGPPPVPGAPVPPTPPNGARA